MNDPVVIKHEASGAQCTVYPYGATVTSFITSKGDETIFVSSLAKRDGSKAIRGGVPLVFPQFGQPNKDMPQHGFLRRNYWKYSNVFSNEQEAGCDFTLDLKDVVDARGDEGIWSVASSSKSGVDCSCRFEVRMTAETLTNRLIIQNKGTNSFNYQTLFHTYYKVNGAKALDPSLTNVQGFEGYNVEDKITGESYVQDDSPIIVDCEVDRIYTPPTSKNIVDVIFCTGEGNTKLGLKSYATTNGKEVPVSAVVWNPFIEKSKKMADFGDEEYHEMICVEPGVISVDTPLEPGTECVFTQEITSITE